MCTRHAPWLGLWLLALSWTALADEAKVVEELVVYSKGAAQGFRFRAWNMKQAERDGRIHLNEDWKGEPWAGISFTPTEKDKPVLVLTPDWIKFGFAKFRINGLADAYGSVGAPCTFQFLFQGAAKRYEHIPNHFYEGGKGIDSDARTWQELLVPLALFDLKPGGKVTALSLQCVLKPTRAFALESLSLVRFSGPREADRAKAESVVAQPWVTWPEYDELPEALKADRNPPLYRDEKFVTADGRRAFLISTWGREDQRQDLGYSRDGKVVAHYDLYDPKTQGFIYEQPLNGKSLSRLGFNCFANQVNPVPFWDAIGYKAKETPSGFTEEAFREYVRAMHAPFFVDMVCFPWTLGRPALDKDTNLPPDMLHDGREHWTPYRIIGKGREAWLTMWRTYAQRYKDAGANVIFYELMNEPAYLATTPDHRAEFVDWLKRRYGTLDKVNETWGTKHGSWDEVKGFKKLNDSPGVFFDYDEYLGDRFTDLITAGRKAIEAITPGVPVAIQTMGGYCAQPRDAIYLSKLIPHERAVLTPTGGGRWSAHVKNDAPKPNTRDYGMSGAPIENDLLLAMSGDKMIVDNEMYAGPKQGRTDLRNRWWQAVMVGLDGSMWFAWSKRGWAWWRGKENVLREADLFPYSLLIPYARRADSIRGTLEFAQEMELVREFVLPKPWGPTPKVAMVYSWANARWRTWDRQLHDKTLHYHAAMRYLHWDFAMLPADMASKDALGRHRLVVAGGIDHVEPELVAQLSEHVKAGGTLIVGEGAMDSDLYGKAVKAEDLLGVKVKGRFEGSSDKLANVGLSDFKLLPGDIAARAGGNEVELRTGARTLWKDSRGRPMVTCHALGAGKVYYIAADLVGYPLAKLLATIREREGPPAALEITDAATGQLAPNILVSRRSYANHHALLLMNLDEFPKCLRIRVRDLDGRWHVSDPLEGRAFVASASDAVWDASHVSRDGIPYCITGENRGLLLFTRTPWAKTKLTSTTASDVKNLFDTELGQWQRSRGDTATPFSMDPSRASYVALAAVANATTADVVKDAKARWQGFPSTEPLVRTFAGIPFQIIRWDHNEMKGYVALHSAATPQHPESVRGVKVGAKASRLFFLHTCGEAADGETLGKYVVRYTDGRSADIPLVVGKTIARLNERVERKGELATGLVTAIGSAWHVTEWKNPQPDAVIESLDLTASPAATGTIVLVAVTLEK